MGRYQCRKEAAKMRARFFPKPTTKLEEDVLRCNMNLAQDLADSGKKVIESKGDGTLDLVKGLVDRAKAKGLTKKAVAQREEVNKSKTLEGKGDVKDG